MSEPTSTTPSTVIYRIVSESVWAEAQERGAFEGSEHDVRDGFIHFSTAAQVAETAAKHYAGSNRLVLLWVSVEALGPSLRWEPSRGGALFPHLYSVLPTSAIFRASPLPLDASGIHVFPTDLD